MRSGFVGMNPYYFMIGLSASPDCLYCPSTRETIQQFLLQFPIQAFQRDKLFRRFNLIGINDDIITVSFLLTGSDVNPGIRRNIFLFWYDLFKDTDKY